MYLTEIINRAVLTVNQPFNNAPFPVEGGVAIVVQDSLHNSNRLRAVAISAAIRPLF